VSEEHVARHYAHGNLEAVILEGLRALGRDPERLQPDDLQPIDEFHMGGRAATTELADRLELAPGLRLLDIGSGLGGAARFLAGRGCQVEGVDLTPDYVGVANSLTRRVGLADRATFRLGSATDLPFPAATFDRATLLHVGMNVADKQKMCAEAGRVLKPGGRFGLYDVMRVGAGEIAYPVAWASGPESSFLAEPAVYREALAQAGFTIVEERDRTDLALDVFRRFQARVAERGLPPLGLHLLMGDSAAAKVANMVANLERGLIAPVMMIARRA
jgi:MPBQ/MSBQ methyltransferase